MIMKTCAKTMFCPTAFNHSNPGKMEIVKCGMPATCEISGVPFCGSCAAEIVIARKNVKPEDKPTSPGTERRRKILAEIEKCVCRDRQNSYGDAEDNFAKIARYWSEWKGVEFTEVDVAAMMVLMKLSRMKTSPFNLDNWIDAAGYAVCGGGIASKANCNQIVDSNNSSDKSTDA